MDNKSKINYILPISIFLITLFQLYFQHSAFKTNHNSYSSEKDWRRQSRYEYNLAEIDIFFNDNILMKKNILKNFVLNGFEKWNDKKYNKLDLEIYELYYLMIYNLIFIIFLCFFIFKVYQAGIVKIILQFFKFFFTARRIKKNNPYISILRIIHNYFDNKKSRNIKLYDSKDYEIFEFICNFVIILDILYLIIIIKEARNSSKENNNEKEIINKKIINNNTKIKAKFLIEQIKSNIKSTSIGGNKTTAQNNKTGIDNNQIKQEIDKFKKAIEKLKKN